MTVEILFETLRKEFKKILAEHGCDVGSISIHAQGMTPEEAIGNTSRKDYPILNGKEIMLKAEYKGCIGQAFTSTPADYEGSLQDIIEADIVSDEYARALFIAALNAVMKYLGLTDKTIHCRNDEPELCAGDCMKWLSDNYDKPKILQVGYQPALFARLAEKYEMRLLDLNPVNIGKEQHGVTVENGKTAMDDAIEWADLILCTGSTLVNGSIVDYMELNKDVRFYGTTLAGAAALLNLNRICFRAE